jgi:competence protein ComEA
MPISKRNRRGLLLLLFISGLISYTPRILAAIAGDPEVIITFEELEVIEKEIDSKRELNKGKKKKVWEARYKSPKAIFDPNEYTEADWLALGLSQKQTDVVLKFSSRGLKSNDDLKKIFVIPTELFDLIKDSTYYPVHQSAKKFDEPTKKEFILVEINSAESDQLKTIPGIGDYFAAKIIEYRLKLGGFTSKEQLLEIWNFSPEKYEDIKDKIVLNPKNVERININTATIDELKSHPYISYKVANSIVKMRLANGDYKVVEDILESKLIDDDLFFKIKSYLKV